MPAAALALGKSLFEVHNLTAAALDKSEDQNLPAVALDRH